MSYNTSQGVACDSNSESDLAGYKFYAGTASHVYDGTLTKTSTSPNVTMTGLAKDVFYYFASTAYDTAGNESTFSAEISKTITMTLLQVLRRVA